MRGAGRIFPAVLPEDEVAMKPTVEGLRSYRPSARGAYRIIFDDEIAGFSS